MEASGAAQKRSPPHDALPFGRIMGGVLQIAQSASDTGSQQEDPPKVSCISALFIESLVLLDRRMNAFETAACASSDPQK